MKQPDFPKGLTSAKRLRRAGIVMLVGCALQWAEAQEEIRKDAGYYFRTEGYELPVLSPGGSYTFTRYRKPTGRHAVVVFDLNSGEAKPFGFGEGEDVGAVRWLDEDTLIISFRNLSLNTLGSNGVFTFRVGDGKLTMVVDYPSNLLGLPVSRAGHAWLSYNSLQKVRLVEVDAFGRVNAKESDEKRNMVRAVRIPDEVTRFPLQADGEVRFAVGRGSDEERAVLYWRADPDPESDRWQAVPADWDSFDYIGVEAGGRGLLVASYGDREYKGLHRLDAASGELGPSLYQSDGHGLDDSAVPLYDRGSNAIKGLRYRTDRFTTVWFDRNFAALQSYVDAQLKGRWNRIFDWTVDGANFLIHSASDDQPDRLFKLDLKNRRMSELTGRMPWQQAPVHFKTERIAFKSRDGYELDGYLTRPQSGPNGERVPLVVVMENSVGGRDTFEFSAIAQWLAANGYACLRVNARNASGQSRALSEALRFDLAGAGRDHVDAVEAVLGDASIDPRRIALIGLGLGAYSGLVAVADRPELFKAALTYEGIFDVPEYVREIFKSAYPSDYQQIKNLTTKSPELAQAYFGGPSEDMLKGVRTEMLLVVQQGFAPGVRRQNWPVYSRYETDAVKVQRTLRKIGGSIKIERLKPVDQTSDLIPIRMEELKALLQGML